MNAPVTSAPKEERLYSTQHRIRMLRENLGYSQEYVAGQLNISQQAYSNLEKNPDSISLKRLKELGKVLNSPIAAVLGEEDSYVQQNFHQQGGQASTVMYVHGLGEIERKAFEEHIRSLKSEIEVLRELLLRKHG
ncbi:helix-turn-helix domain-containing protein [bacterium]|nr:helix-turn-helix domain-containing protein [bacterium]